MYMYNIYKHIYTYIRMHMYMVIRSYAIHMHAYIQVSGPLHACMYLCIRKIDGQAT